MFKKILAFFTLVGLINCTDHKKAETAPQPLHDTSSLTQLTLMTTPVTEKQPAMVVTAHPHATKAGIDMLGRGGSALDAAIAVQATLGLVEPQSSGLGGGAFMLTYDSQTGDIWSYDGRERAPKNMPHDVFLDENGAPLRYFDGIISGRSTGVPGAVAMLHLAHQDYGRLAWGEAHFDYAKDLAVNGFHVSPRMADSIARLSKFALGRQKAARDYFFLEDGKTPLPQGHLLTNPLYAQTLTALADNPRALLEGPIAQEIIDTISEPPLPGSLTLEDLASYQPQKMHPICSSYRDHQICGPQAPASGGIATQAILGLLEPYNMAALGPSIAGWHHFIEASRLAYSDRDQYVADPDFVDVPDQAMLDRAYLESRAALIMPDHIIDNVTAGNPAAFIRGQDATPDSPGTSHFTIMDKNGLVVTMTTTVESAFGSQRMAAGFVLNNQLTDFSFRTHDEAGLAIANAPAPLKRPRSSMGPTLVFAPNGEFLFSTGSPGGSNIIAYIAKTLIAIIDWNMTPQAAIDLPNMIGRGGRVKMEAKNLVDEVTNLPIRTGPAVEFGMSPEIIAALEEKGHNIIRSKGEISGLHIIYRHEDGQLLGGADQRREGVIGIITP